MNAARSLVPKLVCCAFVIFLLAGSFPLVGMLTDDNSPAMPSVKPKMTINTGTQGDFQHIHNRPIIGLEDMNAQIPEFDAGTKERLDEYVGANRIQAVDPENAPAFLTGKASSASRGGTRASSHNEPDHQGQYYNNNRSSAEFLDWRPGTSITYDASSGNQPSLMVNWSADQENPGYSHYYADHDYYKILLNEQDTQIDFVNITLSVDYGTNHGGVYSNPEFGVEMTLFSGPGNSGQVEEHMSVSRQVLHGPTTYGNNFLDSWTDPWFSWYTSLQFSPLYHGFYYLHIRPLNMSVSPSTSNAMLWYNLSLNYSVKSGTGQYSGGEIKNDDPDFYTGYMDLANNRPTRDWDLLRDNSSSLSKSGVPYTKKFVHENIDHNDWYDLTHELNNNSDDTNHVNITIECYNSFLMSLNMGGTMGNVNFLSATYLEVWHHDETTGIWWMQKVWGNAYYNNGENHIWIDLTTNKTTNRLYFKVWTDMLAFKASNGNPYDVEKGFNVYNAWAYYNITQCIVETYKYNGCPELAGSSVSPNEGDEKVTYRYNTTYYSLENKAPRTTNGAMVNIDNTLHTMVQNTSPTDPKLYDGDYRNGEEYIFDHTFDKNDPLHPGGHNYSFLFYDSSGLQAIGDVGPYSGPRVSINSPPNCDPGYCNTSIQVSEDEFNDYPLYFNMSYKCTDMETPYELDFKFGHNATGPWFKYYSDEAMTLKFLPNGTLEFWTKPDKYKEVGLYLNVTDPGGEWVVTKYPQKFRVKSRPDPCLFQYLKYLESDVQIIDKKAFINTQEDATCVLKAVLSDADDLPHSIDLHVGPEDSHPDFWEISGAATLLDDHHIEWTFVFATNGAHVPYVLLNLSVDDHEFTDWVLVNITVLNTNDPPEMRSITFPSIEQYGYLNRTLSATDDDLEFPNSTEQLVFSCNISDSIPGLTKGEDWDINPQTGKFWFHPVDQHIFGRDPENPDRTYDVQFKVTDRAGASDVLNTKIKCKNVNDRPEEIDDFEVIIKDLYVNTPEFENLVITVIAPDVYDLDGDEITYEWDFGDFRPYQRGQTVTYEYAEGGNYSIRLLYSDGYYTREVSKIIEVMELDWYIDPDDLDDDGMDDEWEQRHFGNTIPEPYDDPDGDGFTNLEEYRYDTNPMDPDDTPPDPMPPKDPDDDDDDDDDDSGWELFAKIMKWALAVSIIIIVIVVIIVIYLFMTRQRKEEDVEDENEAARTTKMKKVPDQEEVYAELEYVPPPPPPWWKGDAEGTASEERTEVAPYYQYENTDDHYFAGRGGDDLYYSEGGSRYYEQEESPYGGKDTVEWDSDDDDDDHFEEEPYVEDEYPPPSGEQFYDEQEDPDFLD